MKRSYLLLYILFILSLLFMLVVKITDISMEKNISNSYVRDSLQTRNDYESASHLYLARLDEEGLLKARSQEAAKNSLKENLYYSTISYGSLDDLPVREEYGPGHIKIIIGNDSTEYTSIITIKNYPDSLYDRSCIYNINSQEISNLLLSERILTAGEEILLDGLLIEGSGNDLYYILKDELEAYCEEARGRLEEKESNKEDLVSIDPSQVPVDSALSLANDQEEDRPEGEDGPGSPSSLGDGKVDGLEDHKEGLGGQDASLEQDQEAEEELSSLDQGQGEEGAPLRADQESQEAKVDWEEDLAREEQTFIEANKEQLPKRQALVFKDNIRYDSTVKIRTQGIIFLSGQTEVNCHIDHTGLAIIGPDTDISQGFVQVNGAVFKDDKEYRNIELRPNYPVFQEQLAFFEGSLSPKIDSIVIR